MGQPGPSIFTDIQTGEFSNIPDDWDCKMYSLMLTSVIKLADTIMKKFLWTNSTVYIWGDGFMMAGMSIIHKHDEPFFFLYLENAVSC